IGGRLGGLTQWEAMSVGMGINARGALGIVIAVLGLNLKVLSIPLFSALILMALVTTAMTPPLLRWALGRVKERPEEQERLGQAEESLEVVFGRAAEQVAVDVRSPMLLVRAPQGEETRWPPRHILVPTTGLLTSTQAAELGVAWARPTGARVTALHVVEASGE